MWGGLYGAPGENLGFRGLIGAGFEPKWHLQDFSVGLNWYLFSNMRMMFNYVHSDDMNGSAGANKYNIFQARAQIDF